MNDASRDDWLDSETQNQLLDSRSTDDRHPIGASIGAVLAAGAAGATGGLFGGPAGVVIGAVIGAVAGGIGGRAICELVVRSDSEVSMRDEYTMRTHFQSVANAPNEEGSPESYTKQSCRASWHRLDETDKQLIANDTTDLDEQEFINQGHY